jgi:hypothetical protein
MDGSKTFFEASLKNMAPFLRAFSGEVFGVPSFFCKGFTANGSQNWTSSRATTVACSDKLLSNFINTELEQ